MSKHQISIIAAGMGALATAGLLGALFVAHQIAPDIPFPAFAVTDLIIRLAPGAVATAGIERLGEWARPILRWVGALIVICTGGGLAALADALRTRPAAWIRAAGLAVGAFFLTVAVRTAAGPDLPVGPASWAALLASYVAWASAVVWAVGRVAGESERGDAAQATLTRRGFLIGFAAAAGGLAAGGLALGRRLRPTSAPVPLADLSAASPSSTATPTAPMSTAAETAAAAATRPPSPSTVPTAAPAPATPALAPAAAMPEAPTTDFVPAARTRPNITPLPDFFVVNIGAEYPRIDLARWRLEVKGLVEQPLALTFEELLALPRVDIYGTLECISNEVGGRLIGTTLFSAARMADVLRLARPQGQVVEVVMYAADRYSESMPFDKALHEDTLLVYGMEGHILQPEHGYPLRVYNPNHYGMKGPKWLTRLELVAEPHTGYWSRLGWDKEAIVKTTSVIDGAGAIHNQNGIAQIGGIAFAGWRGIQAVEVQIDGGEFRPAVLDRPLSHLTWVRWRYDWRNPPPGDHTIVVRAFDGNGEEQTPQPAPPHPDGASGWHKVHVTIA